MDDAQFDLICVSHLWWSSQRAVLPSMSVSSNLTVPLGNSPVSVLKGTMAPG